MLNKLRSLLPASTLRNKIFRNLIMFTTVPFLAIAVFITIYTNQKNEKEANDSIRQQLNACIVSINETLVKYIDKSSYIITNRYLVQNLQKDYSQDLEQMIYFLENVSAMIGEPFTDNVKSPYIVHPDNRTLFEGKFVEGIETVEGNTQVELARRSAATAIIWAPELTVKKSKKYITFYRNIVDYQNSVGVLEVNIPYAAIEASMDSVGAPSNGLIFATGANKQTLHFNNQSDTIILDTDRIASGGFIVASGQTKNGDIITIAIPKETLFVKNVRTFGILLTLFLIYILIMLLASRLTARRITGNMESFINKIKRNDALLLHEDLIQITGSDEVSIIKHKFKELVSRMNEMYKEIVKVKLEKSSLELELLQSRMNPHLLYNSLSVIRWTALWNKDHNTVRMIDAMTKYYRTALNKGNSIIRIAEELEMIRQYVQINVFTHSSGYELTIDVEDEIAKLYTLKHLLQPIVENSVLHGLNGMEDARISIIGYAEERDIVFEVSDNGRGMEPETVEQILNLNYSASFGGYGIKNLIKRIQLYYTSRCGIRIDSRPGSGTKVTVRIEALGEEELNDRMKITTELQ